MEEALHQVARFVAMLVEALAIAVIAIGALEALVGTARLLLGGPSDDSARRMVWLKFARWLVAALTFQLAADIVNTSISATWEEVGHLAAVAAIRTFLSFFLDRELDARLATGPAVPEDSHGA